VRLEASQLGKGVALARSQESEVRSQESGVRMEKVDGFAVIFRICSCFSSAPALDNEYKILVSSSINGLNES